MTDRFIPRAQSAIVQGAKEPVDGTWYRFLRELGVDLDAEISALDTHEALWPSHGWTRLANKVLTVGKNTIAHGLSAAPTEVIPYHSSVSGLSSTWLKAIKDGDLVLGSAGAWNDVTGWTETSDTYATFNPTTGVWTCPRTGLYELNANVVISANADGDYGATAFVTGGGSFYGPTYMIKGSSVARHVLSLVESFTLADTVKLQAYRNTGAQSVIADSASFLTRFSARSIDEVNAYAFDATNIYVHSSYNHTRSFLVR